MKYSTAYISIFVLCMLMCSKNNGLSPDDSAIPKDTLVLQNGTGNYSGCKDAYLHWLTNDTIQENLNFGSDSQIRVMNCLP